MHFHPYPDLHLDLKRVQFCSRNYLGSQGGKPICAQPNLSEVSPTLPVKHSDQCQQYQFNSRWYLGAWESPYVLHPISHTFLQHFLQNVAINAVNHDLKRTSYCEPEYAQLQATH